MSERIGIIKRLAVPARRDCPRVRHFAHSRQKVELTPDFCDQESAAMLRKIVRFDAYHCAIGLDTSMSIKYSKTQHTDTSPNLCSQ